MASQANLGLKNYTLGNTKLFAINLAAIAALITAASTLMIGERGVDAQMENHGGDLAGNMTSSLQQHEQKTINNGLI